MNTPGIAVERHDGVAVVRLCAEASRNALTRAMVEQLLEAFARAAREDRALVLTGKGQAFCSGADLVSALDSNAADADVGALLISHFNPLLRAIRELPIPIITAVNGAAAGIGCAIALAGDLVVAGNGAYFLQAFARIGLVPDGGSAFLLTRGAGRARAMEMMLLGDRVPAATALEWGLVNRVVADDELLPEAMRLAARLAAGPTGALGMIRKLCWDALEIGFDDQLAAEAEAQTAAGRTADHREGVAAFLAKRPPRFAA